MNRRSRNRNLSDRIGSTAPYPPPNTPPPLDNAVTTKLRPPSQDLRFIQLYTTPEFEPYRPKLAAPSEGGSLPAEGGHADAAKHVLSPLVRVLCVQGIDREDWRVCWPGQEEAASKGGSIARSNKKTNTHTHTNTKNTNPNQPNQ